MMMARCAPLSDPAIKQSLEDLLTAFDQATRPDQLTRLLQKVQIQCEGGRLSGLVPLRVAVLGNANLSILVNGLKLELLRYHIDATLWEAPYDQWANQLVSPASDLAEFNPQVIILWLSSLGLTQGVTHLSFDIIPLIEESIKTFTTRSAVPFIVVLPEALEEEAAAFSDEGNWRRQFSTELQIRLKNQVLIVDPTAPLEKLGNQQHFSARFWYTAKLPAHPRALIALARYLGRHVAACLPSPIKVIACDLDNTLWGGVVGEDGWRNLKLDPFSEGGPFLRLQAYLKRLKEKGYLIAAVSKNNEKDAREVFQNRKEMILSIDDFVEFRCGWERKSFALIEISKNLNIGLQSFLFIDDSPFERNEVRNTLPEVWVPELPPQPDSFISAILETKLFDVIQVTEEDRKRTNLYQGEALRKKELNKNLSMDQFLTSLNIRVEAHVIGGENMDRAAQLLARTNQFNITNLRHDIANLRILIEDPDAYAYIFHVRDRFGDNGQCGVLIALPKDGTYNIDSWVLSCRVMGRTVERAMFSHLLEWVKSRECNRLIGTYHPSAKNSPVSGLYRELGFQEIPLPNESNVHRYIYELCEPYTGNRYVCIITSDPK